VRAASRVEYRLGGYQVMRWLSYRDVKVLKRPLHERELRIFRDNARRLMR
jgi:hypothetical protein